MRLFFLSSKTTRTFTHSWSPLTHSPATEPTLFLFDIYWDILEFSHPQNLIQWKIGKWSALYAELQDLFCWNVNSFFSPLSYSTTKQITTVKTERAENKRVEQLTKANTSIPQSFNIFIQTQLPHIKFHLLSVFIHLKNWQVCFAIRGNAFSLVPLGFGSSV